MSSPVETSLTAHCARSISPSNDEVRDFSTPLEMTHGGERAILLSCRAQVETSLTAPPCSFHQPFERRSKRFLDSARNDIGGEPPPLSTRSGDAALPPPRAVSPPPQILDTPPRLTVSRATLERSEEHTSELQSPY